MGLTWNHRYLALAIALVIALTIAPTIAPTALHAQSLDDLLRTGRAQADSGKADEAVKTFERAVKLNPQSAEAHMRLGSALGSVAQKVSVIRQPFVAKRIKAEFERAVELDPTLLAPREGLLQFYLRAPGVMGGSEAKAREQAAAIAKLNRLRGHFAAATIANVTKDASGADKAYRAAASEFPDSLNAVTTYANYLLNNDRAEEAFPVLDRYLAKHADDRVALFWFGRTAAVTGKQLDRGEQALKSVLASQGSASQGSASANGPRVTTEAVHLRLGEIAAKRGDKAKARAAFEEALRINPKFEPARKALAAL